MVEETLASRAARDLSVRSREKCLREVRRKTADYGPLFILSIATKIVPGRVCPRTRHRLHARACGFFFTWEDRKHGAEMPSSGARWRLSERPSLSLSFPVLDFDLTITFTLDKIATRPIQGSGRAKRTYI